MERLDPHQIWSGVRGSLAAVPIPVRLALSAENTLERQRAFDRLAAFISLRLMADPEKIEADATLPLFPDLDFVEQDLKAEKIVMSNVIERAPSFGRWLLDQRCRDDAIGALAKQAFIDPGFPRDGTAKDVSKRLNALGADGETHEALETAELDWVAM